MSADRAPSRWREHALQPAPAAAPTDRPGPSRGPELAPYLVDDDCNIHYDSSCIADWLDHTRPSQAPLIPRDPALAYVCRLIEEAIDEIGLYCVHHHRWVTSRNDNTAGARLAHEFRSLLPPPLRPVLARRFSQRQTRRLPYLFSVASEDAGGQIRDAVP